MNWLAKLWHFGGRTAAAEPEHLRRRRLGEAAARRELEHTGLKFLTANYRSEHGELDLVFRDADCLDVVAVNKLGEGVRCTPAIAGNRIYVRGADHLWAVGE